MSTAAKSPNSKVSPADIIDVRIVEEQEDGEPPLVAEYPAPARDSLVDDYDYDTTNNTSLTPFEHAAQSLYDELRKAYNLDPTGKMRAVAVVVTEDQGKTWVVKADSTEGQIYRDKEQWSKVYVESEVVKTKEAYQQKHRDTSNNNKASPV